MYGMKCQVYIEDGLKVEACLNEFLVKIFMTHGGLVKDSNGSLFKIIDWETDSEVDPFLSTIEVYFKMVKLSNPFYCNMTIATVR